MKTGPFVSTLFFAIGAWLENRRPNVSLAMGVLLLVSGLLTHLGEAVILHLAYARPIMSYSYLAGTVPYSVGIMLVALARPNSGSVIVGMIGASSLGIFVFHPYVIEVLLRLPISHNFVNYPFFFSGLVLAITFAGIFLLGKIPGLRLLIK